MKHTFAATLALSCSLIFSACTMDAQLASQLLSSLQSSIKKNTAEDGNVTLTASALASAADEAGIEVVCGGDPMKISSVDDDEEADSDEDQDDDDSDEETEDTTQAQYGHHFQGPLQGANQIHPVMIGRGNAPGQFQRIQIDIHLANELQGLQQWQGAERDQHYQDIQRRYPMMQHARPIRYQGGQQAGQQGRQVMFAQFTEEEGQSRAYPAYPAGKAGYGYAQGANQSGYGYAYAQRGTQTTSAKATTGKVARYPLPAQFLNDMPGAKGQPCSLLSQTESTDDSSDDSEE